MGGSCTTLHTAFYVENGIRRARRSIAQRCPWLNCGRSVMPTRAAGSACTSRCGPRGSASTTGPLRATDPAGCSLPGTRPTCTARRARRAWTPAFKLLVRPDGHVGYRANGSDRQGLFAYHRRWVSITNEQGA